LSTDDLTVVVQHNIKRALAINDDWFKRKPAQGDLAGCAVGDHWFHWQRAERCGKPQRLNHLETCLSLRARPRHLPFSCAQTGSRGIDAQAATAIAPQLAPELGSA
jgi:hypothetical protein